MRTEDDDGVAGEDEMTTGLASTMARPATFARTGQGQACGRWRGSWDGGRPGDEDGRTACGRRLGRGTSRPETRRARDGGAGEVARVRLGTSAWGR